MFENRSFDHIFGALPGVNGLLDNGQIGPNYYNLRIRSSRPSHRTPRFIPPQSIRPNTMAHDLTHDFGDGMMPEFVRPTFTINPADAGPADFNATYTSGT